MGAEGYHRERCKCAGGTQFGGRESTGRRGMLRQVMGGFDKSRPKRTVRDDKWAAAKGEERIAKQQLHARSR